MTKEKFTKLLNINLIWSLLICLLLLCFMLRHDTETRLTELTIKDAVLDSISNDVIRNIYSGDNRNKVLVLSLEETQDSLEYVYTVFASMEEVRYHYLFIRNFRVIGYIEKDGADILVMTNVNNHNRLLEWTDDLLAPKNDSKIFGDLYHAPINSSNWSSGSLSDKIRYHFKYSDGDFHGPTGCMD